MGVTLDGQDLFYDKELKIEVGSICRESLEKSASGLDGVLSIDLGRRSRKIIQKGILRAKSQVQMKAKISEISGYMDGDSHKLISSDGEEFGNLRMDIFKTTEKRTDGGGLCCDYEIIYTQLMV